MMSPSTYFEGQALGNPQAQRGYSRDHRPDCKQVCIALVVTFDGFPLGYEVFAGNTHESRTLQTIVATMEAPCRADRPREETARSGRREPPGRPADASATSAPLPRFVVTLQPNASPAGFHLRVADSAEFDDWAALSEGAYLLRSNIADWSDRQLWKAYIQLTQAEAAFRIQKDQLERPPDLAPARGPRGRAGTAGPLPERISLVKNVVATFHQALVWFGVDPRLCASSARSVSRPPGNARGGKIAWSCAGGNLRVGRCLQTESKEI
jgi:hypothetical protein